MKISSGRLFPLDALRGLIMVLMAVDHASYFVAKVHWGEFWGIALPQHPDIFSFLTRWLTHLCAPGFFFLMGAGIILFAKSRQGAGWPEARITRFLATRGFLLIILQLAVENPAWILGAMGRSLQATEPPGGGGQVMLHFGVLYGLGSAMILWALWKRAHSAVIASISIGSILATQWMVPGASEAGVLFSPLPRLILIPGHTGIWQVFYPLVPWLGIAGLGVIFGKCVLKKRERMFKTAFFAGSGFILLFVFLRLAGGFGNFHPPADGWMSFLNVTKYPPSLSFICLTLGINLALLFLFSKAGHLLSRMGKPLLLFGRTALFFYLVHLYLYALLGMAFPDGTSYPVMYLVWLVGLLILYPLCLWYARFKRRKPLESVWRFF